MWLLHLDRKYILFLFSALSFVILLPQIFGLGLGQDEMSTMSFVTTPGYSSLFWDNTPPLYYFLLKNWFLIFPQTAEMARLLNVVIALNFPILGYKIGEKFFGRGQALVTALLFTFSALHIRYVFEIRSYLLFEILAALNFYFFWDTFKKKRITGYYWITLFALLITHYLAIFWIAAHAIIYFSNKEKVKNRVWLYLFILLIGIFILDKIELSTLTHLDLSNTLLDFQIIRGHVLQYLSFVFLIIIFIFRDNKYRYLDLTFLLVIVMMFIASILTQKIPLVEKYYIFIVPIILIRFADIIVVNKKLGPILLALYLILNILRIGSQYRKPHTAWPDVMRDLPTESGNLFVSYESILANSFYGTSNQKIYKYYDLKNIDWKNINNVYFIYRANISSNKRENFFNYYLVDEKDYGMESYEPLVVRHYRKVAN